MLKNIYFASFIVVLSFLGCKKSDSNTPPPPTTGFLSASATNLTLNGAILNSKDSFNILSNVNWTISILPASATWLTANITSGSGNSKILITTNQLNTTGVDRVAQVIIAATGNLAVPIVTIQVNQTQLNTTIWSKLYGGTLNDQLSKVIKTSDGGYVFTGYALSNDGDLTVNKGNGDFWMAKVNASGVMVWSKTMGGSSNDLGNSVVESSDGGYVFVGVTSSNDGDVIGNHGSGDIWVIKLDVNGNLVWKKTYGGSLYETCYSDMAIADAGNGEFILSGHTSSNDGDVTGNHNIGTGVSDVWVLKISASGSIIWQKCLGGTGSDQGTGVASIAGGGYFVSAISTSSDGDATNNKGNYDLWVIKLNNNGSVIWQKNFGGSGTDYGRSIIATPDGGCTIIGSTESVNGDVIGNHGGRDVWVIKLDSNGSLTWQKCLGGSNTDDAYSICLNASGGYMLTGYTSSTDGDVTGGYTKPDVWIVEVDGLGNKLWQKCVGGSSPIGEQGSSIVMLPNNEFILAGSTSSSDGDVSGQHGVIDGWLYKFRR